MRVVWAVGGDRGWPPEAYVLFASEREARRHASHAAYDDFDAFSMPVHASYEECPEWLKMTSPWGSDVSYAVLVAQESSLKKPSGPAVPRGAQVHGVEPSGIEEPELYALYERGDDARRHVSAAYPMLETRTLPVFDSYEECPDDLRFVERVSPLSFYDVVRRRRARTL